MKQGKNEKDNSMDSMIDSLNKMKQFENMGKGGGMDMMMNMMGANNPEMKNAMQMAQMMSKMQNTNSEKPKETAGDNSQQPSPQEKKSDEPKAESNPLKPITKIANRDITYMLNRYIND